MNTAKKNWVWKSTEDSIRCGKTSFFAVAELVILCFLSLKYGLLLIAFILENYIYPSVNNFYQWYTGVAFQAKDTYPSAIIGTVIAVFLPIFLLRSKQSVSLGSSLLNKYWLPLHWHKAKKIQFTVAFVVSCSMGALACYLLIANLRNELKSPTAYLSIAVGSYIVFLVSFLTWKCQIVFNFENQRSANIFTVTASTISASFLSLGAVVNRAPYSVTLQFFLCFILLSMLILRSRVKIQKDVNEINPTTYLKKTFVESLFTLPFLFALFLRALYTRVIASLCFIKIGLLNLPKNTNDFFFCIDVFHPIKLIPDAEVIEKSLTAKEVSTQLFKSLDLMRSDWQQISAFLVNLQGLVLYFLIGNIYRWSLKSFAWIWLPFIISMRLVLVKSKSEPSDDERRDSSLIGIAYFSNPVLLSLALFLLVVILYTLENNEIRSILDAWFSRQGLGGLLQVFSINGSMQNYPKSVFLILCVGYVPLLTMTLFITASSFKSVFIKDLEDRKINLLSARNLDKYTKSADLLNVMGRLFICSIIQVVWALVLIGYFS